MHIVVSEAGMYWLRAVHVISMVCWFSGLFYLPRLYVYHAAAKENVTSETFKVMEWKLFWYIMTPAGLMTGLLGWTMIFTNYEAYSHMMWLHVKLTLVLILVFYHLYLGKLLFDFRKDQNKHSEKFYRWINEFPAIILVAVVILTFVRPWSG